jgi:hypothetical protein
LLPTYRAITTVEIGDNCSTSFEDNVWLSAGCLAKAYSMMYSHCPDVEVSVHAMVSNDIEHYLVPPRLSRVNEEELHEVIVLLESDVLLPEEYT